MPPLTNATFIGARITRTSVRYGQLAGHDRARAWEQPETREVADPGKDADEHGELHAIERTRTRQDPPQQPEYRLCDAHGPDRAVEIAPFVSFPFRRSAHAGQQTQ